jgi:hypothetical protein
MVSRGLKVTYPKIGLQMADEREFEKASLLPERWYIIMSKVNDETFNMTAYDTTTALEEEDDDYMDAGFVAQQGLMELLQNDFDRVMKAGMARIAFYDVAESIMEDIKDEIDNIDEPRILSKEENVVKVDFGKKQ